MFFINLNDVLTNPMVGRKTKCQILAGILNNYDDILGSSLRKDIALAKNDSLKKRK